MLQVRVFATIFVLALSWQAQAQTADPEPSPAPAARKTVAENAANEKAADKDDRTPPYKFVKRTDEVNVIFTVTDKHGKFVKNLKLVKRTDEVNVIFTVTDKHGKFVKNLKQRDFKILDNDRPPRQITDFQAETDLPLRVGLLIDASNSIRDRFLFEQQAATEFLRQIIRPKSDLAFVLSFDDISETTQDFTNQLDKLTRGILAIQPGGGTALWDAVFYASRDKLLKENSPKGPVRKAIILVSDGDDNQSRVLRKEAIEMAQRAGVIIYAISTNIMSSHDERGDKNLKLLAEATGGRAFFPFKMQQLTDAFYDIQEELRSQYSISYKPAQFQLNGQYRAIRIKADKKKLHVRAKKGYYVPTE